MAVPAVSINYLAVLISTIVGMIIGALWYSPFLFGRAWMSAMKMNEKQMKGSMKKGMGKNYFIAFIALFVMAYVLAHFVKYLGATDVMGGIGAGFWIWLGFIATIAINSILWEGKSFKLYVINVAHWLLVLAVMGAILAVWA